MSPWVDRRYTPASRWPSLTWQRLISERTQPGYSRRGLCACAKRSLIWISAAGFHLLKDGDSWVAVGPDFVDLQIASRVRRGAEEAIEALHDALRLRGVEVLRPPEPVQGPQRWGDITPPRRNEESMISLLKSVLHNIGVVIVGLALAYLGTIVDSLLGAPTFASDLARIVGLLLLALG